MEMAQRNKLNRKIIRASLPLLFLAGDFFGAGLEPEQPLCWLKPTRQSSTLELTRIMEEIISSNGKLL